VHEPLTLSRRHLIGLGGLATLAPLTACRADPDAPDPSPPGGVADPEGRISPADALDRLMAGNERFASGAATHPHQDLDARRAVAEHQHPWALVHGCVDSRVSPELVFDQGVGDVFSTRTAAAVLDDTIVGSMEFALGSPYEVPLIVILGHTGCGAVTATVDALAAAPTRPSAPGEVLDIVNEIVPVARRVRPDPDRTAFVDAVVRANTVAVADALVRRSRIVRRAVQAGRTRVVPAVYDLETGQVSQVSS
jgi:carbonic anhydrase